MSRLGYAILGVLLAGIVAIARSLVRPRRHAPLAPVVLADGVPLSTRRGVAHRFAESVLANLVTTALVAILTYTWASATPPTPSSEAAVLVSAVNEERIGAGVRPVAIAHRLMELAQRRAGYMAGGAGLTHNHGDTSASAEVSAAFGSWVQFGELVGWSSAHGILASGADMTEAWINSSVHKHLLTSPDYALAGVGFARDTSGRGYWSLILVRPSSTAACPYDRTEWA